MAKNVQDIIEKFKNLELSDQELAHLAVTSWQYSGSLDAAPQTDEDGFEVNAGMVRSEPDRAQLQAICRNKFDRNPQVSTAIRGLVGRLTGRGFETSSDIPEIQETIEQIELDPRNRLYNFWPKFVGRFNIEGELFQVLTCHDDGFIEVDFVDPAAVNGGDDDGIIVHPKKQTMPLAYMIDNGEDKEIIPSIFIARYPELLSVLQSRRDYNPKLVQKNRKKVFKPFGGFFRFMISWDKGYITHRAVSYLRTIIEWLNYYELLKKYEIDHKRSAGSYLWVATITDPKAFRLWLAMSDEDKRKTGLGAKKTPGGTLVLPLGMELKAINPTLPKISEGDTDILHMITSGLNEPEDVSTGQSKGTFASVKASRGPMSDRVSDEVAYFERYLRYDFWASIFFLKSKIASFPESFTVREAVDFKNKKPIFKEVKKRPEMLLEISFPTSEVVDAETKARAYLGVKHGSTYDTLRIPNAVIAKQLGHGNYRRLCLEHATEDERYPEIVITADQESVQEQGIEPSQKKKADQQKKKNSDSNSNK